MFGLRPGEYVVAATPMDLGGGMRDQTDQIERAIASGQVNPPSAPGLTPTVSVQMTVPPPGRGMPPPGYLPTYAPSTSTPLDATTVAVAGDDEKTNVDIFLRLVSATTIQGDVQMPTEPGVAMQVMLQIEDATFDGSDNMTTRPDQNGRFYFRTVRPGKYTVMAMTVPAAIPQAPGQPFVQPTLTDAQKVFGRASVTVSGETMINLNLALRPTRSISGVVLFETSRTTDPAQRRGTVTLMQAPGVQQMYYGQMPTAQVAPDGQFVLTGVVPGRYTMRVNSGMLKSLMIGGNDILDFPLDFTGETDVTGAVLTVTDTLSEVSGTLTDAIGKPALGYFILAASTDSRFWTPQSRRVAISYPSPDGRYTFRGLPPGTYSVCALNDFEQGAQYDPEFLKTVAAASISITVIDGGKIQQDIRVK
jgi:hypothetical protein